MRLASAVATTSVTWCGRPNAGSCSRRRCSATAAYSGDSRRSLPMFRMISCDMRILLALVPSARAGLQVLVHELDGGGPLADRRGDPLDGPVPDVAGREDPGHA